MDKPSTFKDFASFKTFIAPAIIKVLFWVGAIALFVSGLLSFVQSISFGYPEGILLSLLYMIGGPFFLRVMCEQIIVFFRILSELKELNKKQ